MAFQTTHFIGSDEVAIEVTASHDGTHIVLIFDDQPLPERPDLINRVRVAVPMGLADALADGILTESWEAGVVDGLVEDDEETVDVETADADYPIEVVTVSAGAALPVEEHQRTECDCGGPLDKDGDCKTALKLLRTG